MPSKVYDKPKRTKKPHAGRAIIFARQYEYIQRKSALYQQQLFYSYGPDYGIIHCLLALTATIDRFNELYQDTMTNKHAIALLCMRHYVTLHKLETFRPEQIRTFYKLDALLGYFVDTRKAFQVLFNDLTHMDFCNPLGKELAPTTRVKVFTSLYSKTLKSLFEQSHQ